MIAVLRQRNFALLWFGGLISMIGDWMLVVALPIYVYRLTGSALATSGAGIAWILPGLLPPYPGFERPGWRIGGSGTVRSREVAGEGDSRRDRLAKPECIDPMRRPEHSIPGKGDEVSV